MSNRYNGSTSKKSNYKIGYNLLSGRPITVFDGYMPNKFVENNNLSKVTVRFRENVIPVMVDIRNESSSIYIRKLYVDIIHDEFINFMDEFGITYTTPDRIIFETKIVGSREKIKTSQPAPKPKPKSKPKKVKKNKGKKSKRNTRRTQPKMTPGFKVPGFRRNIGLWS